MPKISIILPSYNRATYLAQTIDSCLAQTLKDFELIIVDDCSVDASIEVAEFYSQQDSRIKVIANKTNQKLPSTLNIGFEKAKGQYFTWISDDNLFAPNALKEMSSRLDTMPNIGLVYADYTLIDDKGKIGSRIYQEDPDFLPIRDCVGACFLYRADVAKGIGEYDKELTLVEDYEYWLRMGLNTNFFHLSESLYYYRVHPHSLTKTKKEEIRIAKLRLKQVYLSKYRIPEKYKPISDLYMWFIEKKNLLSWFKLVKILGLSPVVILRYIMRNFRRL